jgi:hypothetical protein
MENTEILDYEREKYKEAVWVNKQNITVYKARVSGPDYFEKGVHRLIENIQDDYDIDEVSFSFEGHPDDLDSEPLKHAFVSWQIEGQRLQKSKVHFAQVDDEYEITLAITNIPKAQADAGL